ncbi:hypothetical protein ANTPLA_LOCUS7163 [Anthophora plagiata]
MTGKYSNMLKHAFYNKQKCALSPLILVIVLSTCKFEMSRLELFRFNYTPLKYSSRFNKATRLSSIIQSLKTQKLKYQLTNFINFVK